MKQLSDNYFSKEQYELNKKMVGEAIFHTVSSIGSLFMYPPAALIPLGIGATRIYWIYKNNKEIENKIQLMKKK